MMTKAEAINIIKEADFFSEGFTNYWHITRELEKKFGLVCDKDYRIGKGVTKYCIIFKDCGFVIKFAQNKSYNADVMREHAIYRKAKTKGVSDAFPKTTVLCRVKGITYLAQDKIDFSCREIEMDADYESNKKAFSKIVKGITKVAYDEMKTNFNKAYHGYYVRELDDLWAKMVIATYGKVFANALGEFVKENDINDLHRSNIGYKNNKPVLIDFCGYFG